MSEASPLADGLRAWSWCAAAIAAEVALYMSYRVHDARFHWLTHFLVGASFALVGMATWAMRANRPAPLPLGWILLAHLYAMFPDFLFGCGIAHERWMDVFLAHLSSHFVPGRSLTWLGLFGAALGAYLLVVDRVMHTQMVSAAVGDASAPARFGSRCPPSSG